MSNRIILHFSRNSFWSSRACLAWPSVAGRGSCSATTTSRASARSPTAEVSHNDNGDCDVDGYDYNNMLVQLLYVINVIMTFIIRIAIINLAKWGTNQVIPINIVFGSSRTHASNSPSFTSISRTQLLITLLPTGPVYFADPDDCSAYCECSAGIAWKFFCGPETLYDENLHLCNWEDMVDCGERPII